MDILYAPWRTRYTNDRESATRKEKALESECVFCTQNADANDSDHFILKRTKRCVVMLNLFPYNPGHLLVIPCAHEASLDALDNQTRTELMELISHSCTILQKAMKAQGVNVGLNLGLAAGAGIPAHLHWHVLPRWQGDTNFMPLVANTKVLSLNMQQIYADLKPHFDQLSI